MVHWGIFLRSYVRLCYFPLPDVGLGVQSLPRDFIARTLGLTVLQNGQR